MLAFDRELRGRIVDQSQCAVTASARVGGGQGLSTAIKSDQRRWENSATMRVAGRPKRVVSRERQQLRWSDAFLRQITGQSWKNPGAAGRRRQRLGQLPQLSCRHRAKVIEGGVDYRHALPEKNTGSVIGRTLADVLGAHAA